MSAQKGFKNAAEITLALTEEIGEVAQEVALLERIGSKANWAKAGDREQLRTEISHAMNCLRALEEFYDLERPQ